MIVLLYRFMTFFNETPRSWRGVFHFLERFQYGEKGLLEGTQVRPYTKNNWLFELEDVGCKIIEYHYTTITFENILTGKTSFLVLTSKPSTSDRHTLVSLFWYHVLIEAKANSLDYTTNEALFGRYMYDRIIHP